LRFTFEMGDAAGVSKAFMPRASSSGGVEARPGRGTEGVKIHGTRRGVLLVNFLDVPWS
jgi:hypothetical protein